MRRVKVTGAVVLFLLIWSGVFVQAQSTNPGIPTKSIHGKQDKSYPVLLGEEVLFHIHSGFKSLSAEERAAAISARIRKLAEDPYFRVNSITVAEADDSVDIMAGDRIIMSVFRKEARLRGQTSIDLAETNAAILRKAIAGYQKEYGDRNLLQGLLYAAIATMVLIGLVLLLLLLYRRSKVAVESLMQKKSSSLRIQDFEIIRADSVRTILNGTAKIIFTVIFLVAFYVYIQFTLSLFPQTRGIAQELLEFILKPTKTIGLAVLTYIPNLVFIVILGLLTSYVLKLLRPFFDGIEKGTINLENFYPEWAKPTYTLVRFLVIVLAIMIAYPFIPGSDSGVFKGISIFLGVLISIGSSSVVSNIVAGYALIYRRAFRIGDRVRINDIVGDVKELRIQVTLLHTIKNEEVIIPNSTIMNSHVINYSSLARENGLILYTTVTIGYDTPWRQVHAMLIMAAERTPGLRRDPAPFVFQRSLDDFYVRYELNAYTDKPQEMVGIYSDLHQNIQDAFNEYGVQIMSPNYVRDPDHPKLVPKDQWYVLPAKREDQTKGTAS
ncbi:MAG: mechanosensitive ion channel domain-containing protein [Syntrophus sp. (in: bacteria)]